MNIDINVELLGVDYLKALDEELEDLYIEIATIQAERFMENKYQGIQIYDISGTIPVLFSIYVEEFTRVFKSYLRQKKTKGNLTLTSILTINGINMEQEIKEIVFTPEQIELACNRATDELRLLYPKKNLRYYNKAEDIMKWKPKYQDEFDDLYTKYLDKPKDWIKLPNQQSDVSWTPYLATAYAEGFGEGENASRELQIEAWASLIFIGLAWRLQGWFGRTANNMIQDGYIDKLGVINWENVKEIQ